MYKILIAAPLTLAAQILVKKIQEIAVQKGEKFEVTLLSETEATKQHSQFDVILLAPTLRFLINYDIFPEKTTTVIESEDFGSLDATAIFQNICSLIVSANI